MCLKPADRVDHFIAWAHYAIDLGHNLVRAMADATTKNEIDCWRPNACPPGTEKTADFEDQMGTALEELLGIIALPQAWERMAGWGYAQTEAALRWRRADEE